MKGRWLLRSIAISIVVGVGGAPIKAITYRTAAWPSFARQQLLFRARESANDERRRIGIIACDPNANRDEIG